jgi:hypothetical protein
VPLVIQAVKNYSLSQQAQEGYSRDAIRFLRNDFWRDWLEPEQEEPKRRWGNASQTPINSQMDDFNARLKAASEKLGKEI